MHLPQGSNGPHGLRQDSLSATPSDGAESDGADGSPLLRRLEEYADLPPAARDALETLCAGPVRSVPARRDLIKHGAAPPAIYLVSEGWACRYKTLPDGRRQVVDFLIPGDLCDLDIFILGRMDHSVGAVTPLEVVEIAPAALEAVVDAHPQITRALWWQELVRKSCYREWIVNVGARSAVARVAHLLCETFLRLESIGGTQDHSCPFPLTQRDLADATGLTPVHVNRTVQRLREQGLVSLAQRILTIPDMAALMAAGQFNPDYLHHKRLDRHTLRRPREVA
jgi:CRP-like cAMP-binding protein